MDFGVTDIFVFVIYKKNYMTIWCREVCDTVELASGEPYIEVDRK